MLLRPRIDVTAGLWFLRTHELHARDHAMVKRQLRFVRRNPAHALQVVACLALGAGVALATVAILSAQLFEPPAGVRHASNIWRVALRPQVGSGEGAALGDRASYPDFLVLEQSFPHGDVAVYATEFASVRSGDRAHEQRIGLVSGEYFSLLGVRAVRGRVLDTSDDRQGAAPVALVAAHFWRSSFGSDTGVIGRAIRIHDQRFTIVGVAAPEFCGLETGCEDIWIPLADAESVDELPFLVRSPSRSWLQVIARLGDGVPSDAAARLATQALASSGLAELSYPGMGRVRREVVLRPLSQRTRTDERAARIPLLLFYGALIVLIVGCLNAGGLVVANLYGRKRELLTRLALGATRRQLLAEQLLLAICYSFVAILIALAVAVALRALAERWGYIGRTATSGWSLLVLAVPLVFALMAGALTAPFAELSEHHIGGQLARSSASIVQSFRSRRLLLALQVASCALLLALGAIVAETARELERPVLGFRPEQLTVVTIEQPTDPDAHVALRAAGDRLRAAPGVMHVALTSTIPFRSRSMMPVALPDAADDRTVMVLQTAVDTDFFTTLEIPIVQGRGFTGSDINGSPLVAIVNRAMAKAFWPERSPTGACFGVVESRCAVRVVGIVENTAYTDPQDRDVPILYTPFAQGPSNIIAALLVRTREPGARGAALVSRVLSRSSRDENERAVRVEPLQELLQPFLTPWVLARRLIDAFAALLLVIAAGGVVALCDVLVTERVREIGIRRALGANASDVLRLASRELIGLVTLGVSVGLVAAAVAWRLLPKFVPGTHAPSLVSLARVAVVIVAAVGVGASAPMWRALRVSPREALND